MKWIKGKTNSGGRAVVTAAMVAIAVMALPALAEAQSRHSGHDRAEAASHGDGDHQTRRERATARHEARREHRSERREASRQRHDRWRDNRRDRHQTRRDNRPTTWRHNNTRHPAYRTPSPRRNYYAWQRQQKIARYRAQQRYWAGKRHQARRHQTHRPIRHYGHRHRTSAPAISWNFYRN